MVLLGAPLPPVSGVSHALPRPSRQPKSLSPRIKDLASKLQGPESQGACSELALLASRSLSACRAVADAQIEPELTKLLASSADTTTQRWTLSILSNCAVVGGARERQAVAVPALCKLVMSPSPEVQHAAALHLATLSHSTVIQAAFGENQRALKALHAIEGKASVSFGPGQRTLQQEASTYARWALRTAQGRHYKPAYIPKSDEVVALEASVNIQKRVRSSLVAASYRKEMQLRRSAATILQAGYRSHDSRSKMAAEMLVMGPAAALLQGVMRGRQQRQRDAAEKAQREVENNAAAAKVQARVRGNKARTAKGGAEAEAEELVTFQLSVECTDGTLALPLTVGDAPAPEPAAEAEAATEAAGAEEDAAAAKVQARIRGNKARATKGGAEAPAVEEAATEAAPAEDAADEDAAAAKVQARIRGNKVRATKGGAEAPAAEEAATEAAVTEAPADEDAAAAKVQARIRGNKVRATKGGAEATEAPAEAAEGEATAEAPVEAADGEASA